MHRAQHSPHDRDQSAAEVIVPSPIGTIFVRTDSHTLTHLCLGRIVHGKRQQRVHEQHIAMPFVQACIRYFQGDLGAFGHVPMHLGGTAFQRAVWEATKRIPPGTTLSYAALARSIGKPKACRAVAQALKRNPLALIIPCHRVVPSRYNSTKSQHAGGYAWGRTKKAWLLQHELQHTMH